MPDLDANALSSDLSASDLLSGHEEIDSRLNVGQMRSLIDSILPFEACLYHEIIPLSVEASCLHLGMVDPGDGAAIDYARKQLAFIRCSVVSWPVTSDWQRKLLSKYLSYAARTKARLQAESAAAAPLPIPSDELLTFIVDSPDDLRGSPGLDRDVLSKDRAETVAPHPDDTRRDPPDEAKAVEALGQGQQQQRAAIAAHQPLQLNLAPGLYQGPIDQMHHLPVPQLAQALLNQVLNGGIGRLYFERRPYHGQVLWSKDGVVQAALKNLGLDQLQGVINELKNIAHLPLLPSDKTREADIERLYQGERVLLRLRLIAGKHGEEATLQVLRGAALRFYQQQQVKKMGEDALGVAKTLQSRISQIRDRACESLVAESPSARTLEALSQLLKTMEEQIDQIIHAPGNSGEDNLP